MKGLFNIGFRDEEFDGLKFRSENKYSSEYYEKLYDEGSHYSEVKYADALEEDTMEGVHIKLSYSMVLRIVSVILLVIAIACTFIKLIIPALATLGAGAVLFIISMILNRKANEEYALRETSRSFVSLVFNDRQEEMEEEENRQQRKRESN